MAEHREKHLRQSLDELEGVTTGPPTYDSGLVTRCTALRTKPIGEFGVEDLRIMIGQQIGLRWLLPLAVDALEQNPMAQGAYYPGDLLAAVFQADPALWKERPDLHRRVKAVVARLGPLEDAFLARACETFKRQGP